MQATFNGSALEGATALADKVATQTGTIYARGYRDLAALIRTLDRQTLDTVKEVA